MGEVAVRRAAPEDEPLVRRLAGDMEGCEFAAAPFRARFLALLADPRRACFVVELDEEPAGYLSMRVEEPLHHELPVAEVVELAVAPEARGRGLGARLFSHACAWAEREGCELVEVHSKLHRSRAHRFYERQGMERTHAHFTMALHPAGGAAAGGWRR